MLFKVRIVDLVGCFVEAKDRDQAIKVALENAFKNKKWMGRLRFEVDELKREKSVHE